MDNKIDGIQKINPKDIAKSRKVVLDSIAEETRKLEEMQLEQKNTPKKIDGISLVKKLRKEIIPSKHKEELGTVPDFKQDEDEIEAAEFKNNKKENKEETAKRLHEERQLREEILRKKREEVDGNIREVREREKEEQEKLNQKKEEEQEKNRKEKEKELQKQEEMKKRQEEKIAKEKQKEQEREQKMKKKKDDEKRNEKERIKKEKEKEKEQQEKEKRKQEEKIAKEKERGQRIKNKAQRKKRRAQIRKARIVELRTALKDFYLLAKKHFLINLKKSFFIFLISLLVVVLLYCIFIIVVIRFKLDTSFSRYISSYFPVPALITEGNIIEYYEYSDLRRAISGEYQDDEKLNLATRTLLLNKIILKDLATRYNVDSVEEISNKFIYDEEVNQVAYNRIYKIKELIKSKDDFVRVAVKFADEQGKLDFNSSDEAVEIFGEKIKDLEVGEVSDVLLGKEGYYVVRRYEKNGSNFPVSYCLIRPRTLEEYLARSSTSFKIWSFVD